MQTIGQISNPKKSQLSMVMESTQINNKAHLFQIGNVQQERDLKLQSFRKQLQSNNLQSTGTLIAGSIP